MSKCRAVVDEGAVARFFAGRRIAVVGVGSSPSSFGRTVFQAFAEHGYDAVPVGRGSTLSEVVAEGGPLDGVVVMVPAAGAGAVVAEAAALGVERVWLFRGLGSEGALSGEVLAQCERLGLDVVAGACPLMFLEPVGGMHRFHRWVRRTRGALQAA